MELEPHKNGPAPQLCFHDHPTAEMPDRPASCQSATGLKKINDAGARPVPDYSGVVQHFFAPVRDCDGECRNADASVSFLDADAHL
jgi:hypothetical protein